MAVFHGILKFVPAEICGKTPCAEVLTGEIYGIGTGAYSRVKCLGTACGRKKFGDFYLCTFGDGRDMPVLSFTARSFTALYFISSHAGFFSVANLTHFYLQTYCQDIFGLLWIIIGLLSCNYQITVRLLSDYRHVIINLFSKSVREHNHVTAQSQPLLRMETADTENCPMLAHSLNQMPYTYYIGIAYPCLNRG